MSHDPRNERRAERLRSASQRGLRDGIASSLRIGGPVRPARPTVKRAPGSLQEDAQQVARDGKRLFRGFGD